MAVGLTPRYNETLALENLSHPQFLALAVEAAKKESWDISYVSEAGFIAYTNNGIMTWNGCVKLKIEDAIASLVSESTGSDMVDFGKNRKNLQSFMAAFHGLKANYTAERLDEIYEELKLSFVPKEEDILILPPQTTREKVIEFLSIFKPTQGFFITPILLDINILLFILMTLSGVNIMEPDNDSLLTWGANFRPSTLNGEWWRLITSFFLHIGIIHLLFNMYALLYIGLLLEPLLGRARFLAAYVLAGISSSVVSLWWHDLTISAGASGAIFGMYGVFLAMLTTNLIEKAQRRSLLSSIGVFVGYNLLFGLKGGVDNAAHIGGLISGMLIGYSFYPSILKYDSQKIKLATISIVTVVVLSASFLFYSNTSNDLGIYQKKLDEFVALETKALEAFDTSKIHTAEEQIRFIKNTGIPAWKEGINVINSTETLDIPEPYHAKNFKFMKYCELRIKSYELIINSITENTDKYNAQMSETDRQIGTIIEELNNM